MNGHLNYKTVINLPLENISTIYDVDVLDNQMFITTNKGVIKGVISENNISWSIYLSDNLEKSFFNNGDLFSGQFRGEDIVDIVSFNSNQFNFEYIKLNKPYLLDAGYIPNFTAIVLNMHTALQLCNCNLEYHLYTFHVFY